MLLLVFAAVVDVGVTIFFASVIDNNESLCVGKGICEICYENLTSIGRIPNW